MGSSASSGFTIWISEGSTRAVSPCHPPTANKPPIVRIRLLMISHDPCTIWSGIRKVERGRGIAISSAEGVIYSFWHGCAMARKSFSLCDTRFGIRSRFWAHPAVTFDGSQCDPDEAPGTHSPRSRFHAPYLIAAAAGQLW